MGPGTNSGEVYQTLTISVVVMMQWMKLNCIRLFSFSSFWQGQQTQKVNPNFSICGQILAKFSSSLWIPRPYQAKCLGSRVSFQWGIPDTALMGAVQGHPSCKGPKPLQLDSLCLEEQCLYSKYCQAPHYTITYMSRKPMKERHLCCR